MTSSVSTENVYPVNLGTSALQLVGTLQQVIQSEGSGRLTLSTTEGQTWSLYFQAGRIIWASGGEHRFRRWHRVLRQLNISPASIQIRERILPAQWEHLVLTVLVKRQRIQKRDAMAAITANVTEVLFDVIQASPFINEMRCCSSQKSIGDSPVTILGAPDELIGNARVALKGWQVTALGEYSPNLAPVIVSHEALKRQVAPQSYADLASILTGKLSLRDVAASKRQSLATLAQTLEPFVKSGIVAFQPIADIPAPAPSQGSGDRRSRASDRVVAVAETAPPLSNPPGPLIICVDDSPQVGYIMEQILMPLGYQVLSMQDPVEALSVIMRRKPEFIFLDLVMPVVSGYELCSQVRRVSIFKTTPIVILTGNDGVIDRVRAKMVGATDFVGKPVVPDKVLELLQKHLAYEPIAEPISGADLAAV